MLDLESLGTKPGSVIASIGAVHFDPNTKELMDTFYTKIDIQSCVDAGLTMDPATVVWWMQQSDQARSSTFAGPTVELETALKMFSNFIGNIAGKNTRIWGNGSDFDNVLLGCAYKALGSPPPWSYGKNRCFRTMKSIALSKDIIMPTRDGTHHNALDDAIYQARCLQAITANLQIIIA